MNASFSISNFGNNTLTISCGELARLANGSTVISYGDTVLLATACMSKEPRPSGGFLPLFVDYQEKTYAMGKIPGGYIKREGRPKDAEILSSRLIDRPIRPLFPKGLTNEIQVVAMVLSSDGKNDPDILAINGASSALYISDIPFDNPVGAVRISKKSGEFTLNPTYEEREGAIMDLVVVGTEEKIVMLEGQLTEVSEAEVLGAIGFAHPFIRQIIELQKKLREEAGKEKKQVELSKIDENILKRVNEHV
ncbi:MAG: polyribonucleotide nucleotidyltransferase, partial [Candidatus Omnitrophota bacterium]